MARDEAAGMRREPYRPSRALSQPQWRDALRFPPNGFCGVNPQLSLLDCFPIWSDLPIRRLPTRGRRAMLHDW